MSFDDDDRLQAICDEIVATREQMSEELGRWLGRMQNDTLAVETRIFPASNVISRAYRAIAGAIEVTNLSTTTTITVVASGPDDAPPGQGTGVYVVPPASTRTIALASHNVTLYGTHDQYVSFQVFAAGISPTA